MYSLPTSFRLKWSERIPLTTEGVSRLHTVSGVYRLVYQNGNDFTVYYVGQAVDLAARMTDHLADNEQNNCCKRITGRYPHFYRVAGVETSNLDSCERALWENYGGRQGLLCNERIPIVTPANINMD